MGKYRDDKIKDKIKKLWRKENKVPRNFKNIRSLFDILKENNKLDFYLDDETFQDLNMEDVFCKVDRTHTTVGQQVLYSMMRTPLNDEYKLNKRNEKIEYFQDNYNDRVKLELELYKIGKSKSDVFDFLWSKFRSENKAEIIFYILPILNLVTIIGLFIFGLNSSLLMVAVMLVLFEVILHYKTQATLNIYMSSMKYLGWLISGAERIGKLNMPVIKEYTDVLAKSSSDCKTIKKKAANMGMNVHSDIVDTIRDYINILTLQQERAFYSVIKEINNSEVKEQLQQIYKYIGELDAIISIASYREGMDDWCKPELTPSGKFIKAIGVYHPMLDEPIANDIIMDSRGIVLTGSNMSGKSTFLRTIGANAVLAQTIFTCNAKSYSSSYFYILSSISPQDNLLSGKSYYYGEVEGILRIINKCNKDIPTLALVDEIFRGTNPVERVSAASEILKYLHKNNALVIVATHDLELTKLLKDSYDCYYFREEIEEDKFIFDYLIKRGVSPTRNAIRILKYIGYPDEIVDNAENLILKSSTQ